MMESSIEFPQFNYTSFLDSSLVWTVRSIVGLNILWWVNASQAF